jgi:D-amino peptidase
MHDLAAVVRGFRDAGASEIVILDGHGNQACVPHLAEPGATYITGLPRPDYLYGLDDSFDGIAMIGLHAMNGTPEAVLHHTQSSRGENRYWYNGVESGEIAQVAIVASHYDVPPILVSGDEATCREATQFLGPECVTVATKRGINREAVVLYPFEQTRRALYEGAKRAVAAIPRCKVYRVDLPIQAKKQWLVNEKDKPPRQETKEGTITDVLNLLKF